MIYLLRFSSKRSNIKFFLLVRKTAVLFFLLVYIANTVLVRLNVSQRTILKEGDKI